MFKNVEFQGWTTKRKIDVIDLPNQSTDPNAEKLSFAFVTLMQDRDYTVAVRDGQGAIQYESDGKTPKREAITDALTLKFRNGSSRSIAKWKPEGTSRKIQGVGHLETYQTTENYVMVRGTDGKLTKRELFYYAPDPQNPGQNKKMFIEHVVTHTVIVVDEWEFVDGPKETTQQVAAPATAQDMESPIGGVEGDMLPGAEATPANTQVGGAAGDVVGAGTKDDNMPQF